MSEQLLASKRLPRKILGVNSQQVTNAHTEFVNNKQATITPSTPPPVLLAQSSAGVAVKKQQQQPPSTSTTAQQQQHQQQIQQQQQQQQTSAAATALSSSSNSQLTPTLTPTKITTTTTITTTSASLTLTPQQQQQMERLRLTNMMNQEMHALWPYGTATFLSPMLPAPNMALPYALAGTLPYAAVPIYPSNAAAAAAAAAATVAGLQPNPNAAAAAAAQQQCNNISPVSQSSNGGASAAAGGIACSSSSNASSASGSQAANNNNNGNNSSSVPSLRSPGNNDSNKINIQIGLQCVSQNTPMNLNSMNDINASLAKVNLLNFCATAADKENKESTSSLRSSPLLLSPDDLGSNVTCVSNAIGSGSGAGGDATNASNSPGSAVNTNAVTLSQAKFNELTRLALRGSEIAEKLAYTHRNRPCFKKIDSLCARMKQDLIRPDGVLPNINSQGIAWAVKDFIFVFTRVINAWIIIKGYVYNTPEGLNKVKAALSPDFASSFAAWQDTTMDFVENLIKSFVNLDNLVQSQKNVYLKTENNGTRTTASTTPIKLLQPLTTLLEDSFDLLNTSVEKSQQSVLNKNYLYTMVEDSEGSQRQATVNGTYFKTGTYNPIKKDTLLVDNQQPNATTTGVTTTATPNTTTAQQQQQQHLLATNSPLEQYFDEQISELWSPTEVDNATAAVEYLKIKEKIPPNWLNYDIRVLEKNLTEFSNDYDPQAPPRPLGKDLIDKLNVMIERLMAMKNADLFFKLQFTKNYFPEFIAKHKHDFVDVRSIILKCQVGGYQHIFEVVHDVKKIVYIGREYLKRNSDTKLQNAVTAFEGEFNKLLSEPPFEDYQFDHITGEPKEMLYNCRNK